MWEGSSLGIHCASGWHNSFQQYGISEATHVSRIREGAQLDVIALIFCTGITVWTVPMTPIIPDDPSLVRL